MKGQVAKIYSMLDTATRRKLMVVAMLMCLATGFEMVGLGLLLPLFQLLLAPDSVSRLPVIGGFIAHMAAENPKHAIGVICTTLLVFYVVKSVVLGLIDWHNTFFIMGRQAAFAQHMLRSYLRRPYESLMGRNSAELVRNITVLSTRLFLKGVQPIIQMSMEGLASLGIIALLLAVDPAVTLGIGAVMGGSVAVSYGLIRRRLNRWGAAAVTHDRDALVWLNQALGAPKVTKLAGLETFFCTRFGTPIKARANANALSQCASAWPRLIIEAVAVVALMAVILVLVVVMGRPAATILPTVGILGAAAMRLLPSIGKITTALSLLRENVAAVDILHAEGFGHDEPELAPAQAAGELEFRQELRLESISYRYPGTEAAVLDGIDLVIPAGSSVALVGRSGAGKTTLADMILGLLRPSAGRILVDGRDITGDPSAWQARLGYIPQDIYLLDDTLARNIALGQEDDAIDPTLLNDSVRAARLEELIAALPQGLDTKVGERGTRLSGGQRQRVGIARALYRRPDVLVLDEATSALDTETERDISEAIAALSGDKTLIIIAHRLSTVRHCDTIVLMEAGRIADQGSFADLAQRNSDFARMVSLSQLPDGDTVPLS